MYKSFSFKDVMPGTCSNPNTESSSLLSPAFMKNSLCGVRKTADRMSEERRGVLALSWTYHRILGNSDPKKYD